MTYPRWILSLILAYLTSSSVGMADVPVASWPDEDSEPTPAQSGTAVALPPNLSASTQDSSHPLVDRSSPNQPEPRRASGVTPALTNNGTNSARGSRPMNETPSALVPTARGPTTGTSTLRILAKATGSRVLVFPYREDPAQYLEDAALLLCQSSCSVELPHGRYSLRVVTIDGEVSYGDLTLNTARWVSVAPAEQVTRDLGFTMGIVGAVATVLGGAVLADAICDSCSKVARNMIGGLSLGIGIPMLAVGGSMYIAYRSASVEDQVLLHTETASHNAARSSLRNLSQGWIGAGFRF